MRAMVFVFAAFSRISHASTDGDTIDYHLHHSIHEMLWTDVTYRKGETGKQQFRSQDMEGVYLPRRISGDTEAGVAVWRSRPTWSRAWTAPHGLCRRRRRHDHREANWRCREHQIGWNWSQNGRKKTTTFKREILRQANHRLTPVGRIGLTSVL